MAGLTLAALLGQKGVNVEVIDRADDFEQAGYMLGLWPLGSRVLHGLGRFDDFVAVSQPMLAYEIHNGAGNLVHGYDFRPIVEEFGYVGQLMRSELLDLLRKAAANVPLRMSTSLERIDDRGDEVRATTSDGAEEAYDLIVGADGIHSTTRRLLFGDIRTYVTGWSCRVWTTREIPPPHEVVKEYWGAGRFIGVYPTREVTGIIAGAPHDVVADIDDRKSLLAAFAEHGGGAQEVLATAPEHGGTYLWRLDDVRCEHWFKGRVALCGDSVCAFLPTAGVGASMAMESAAVLADELGRTDGKFIPRALELYEKRRKRRVEGAQDDSRTLARMMFVKSMPLVWGRDQMIKFYTLEMLASNITKSLSIPV
jgi:2-polyprenyl-6-methoxyphenol hydroxylase-like FAD-dependent oxidoreductase